MNVALTVTFTGPSSYGLVALMYLALLDNVVLLVSTPSFVMFTVPSNSTVTPSGTSGINIILSDKILSMVP